MATDPVPGDGLLHPIPLLAVLVLVVNDHWAKGAFPGAITGKISDFAGLVFFPLFLQALVEVALSGFGRPWAPSRRVLAGAAIATALVFAAVKLGPLAPVYSHGLGLLQWPFRVVLAMVTGVPVDGPAPVSVTADPTDLIALPAVLAGGLVRRGG